MDLYSTRWIMILCLIAMIGSFAVGSVLQIIVISKLDAITTLSKTDAAPELRNKPEEKEKSRVKPVSMETATFASLIPAWQVEVYEADGSRAVEDYRRGQIAGKFLHTGDWISMDEHRKHAGVFTRIIHKGCRAA